MIKRMQAHNILISALMTSAAVLAVSSGAFAQTGQATEEVVVTGSRIPEPNMTSVSPINVVSGEEAKFEGTVSAETLLQNLPSVQGAYNGGTSVLGASGTSTVSLRNLGSFRTLVLVDGNRLMPGDPVVPAPDLKNIPSALIKRVEVVTGGASAVYGSDAVAGVVNFILDRDFSGVRLDAQYGFADHNNGNTAAQSALNAASVAVPSSRLDGFNYTATALFGTELNDNKGNVTGYISYSKQTPITGAARDYSACSIGTFQSTTTVFDTHSCQGNPTNLYGRFLNFNVSDNPNGTNTFVPYQNSFGYNINPFNDLAQADERYNAGYFAHYAINSTTEVYSDLMFTDDVQVSEGPPSGPAFNNGTHAINCANPLMSATQAAVICGPTAPKIVNGVSYNLAIGYRIPQTVRFKTLSHDAFEFGLGLRGKISDHWKYDLRAQQGRTAYSQAFIGDVSNTKINNALNVVNSPTGPTCADPNAVAAGCVPLNIFQANSVGITPQALAYIQVPAYKTGYTSEQVVNANITGDLSEIGGKSPWASEPIGVAVGAEYRREMLLLNSDAEFTTGDLAGGGGVQGGAKGGYYVWDFYGEARVPIIQDQPFAKNVGLELGYRRSSYSLAGATDAYKGSVDWSITDDVRLRGGYNRAVRAPNLIELFSPQVITLASFSDPCTGAASAVPSGCANTFSSPAQASALLGKVPICVQAQCNVLQGSPTGQNALKPEQADTITLGMVLSPTWLSGFTASLDYFNIAIANPIVAGIGPSLILSQCVTNNLYCNLIHRDPSTGSLFGGSLNNGYIQNITTNAGSLRTSGFDINTAYQVDLDDLGLDGWGSVAANFEGTATDNFTKQPVAGAGHYDCAGLYGLTCGEPMPTWRHQMRFTWVSPWAVSLSLNWRHMSHVNLDLNASNNPLLATRGASFQDSIDGQIPSYNYFDLAMSWNVLENFQLRAGINNLFDKDPPVVDGGGNLGIAGFQGFGNGNTYPGVYDAIGRTVFVGVTAKL